MRTHVALLRGINVGGHARVAMADLRELVASLGHSDVATYIQSGNVVFGAPGGTSDGIADSLEAAIAERLGVTPSVVVLSREQLMAIVAANPFPPQDAAPRFLHVVFRRRAVSAAGVAAVEAAQRRCAEAGSDDQVAVVDGTVYLRTPSGSGRSDLAVQVARLDAAGEAPGTARNWATVTKLVELLDA